MNIKRLTVEGMLSEGTMLVQVDARACAGLPQQHAENHELVLRMGNALVPSMGLYTDDSGVGGLFGFNGTTIPCYIPWRSIYACWIQGDPERVVFPASLPRTESPERATIPEPEPQKPGRPKLTLVP